MTTEDVNLHLGRRLAQRRAELGLSLAEVSSRCGVSLQQVHRYEIGANTMSAPMLWQLSRCLGVPVGYFFEGLDAETPVPRAPSRMTMQTARLNPPGDAAPARNPEPGPASAGLRPRPSPH